MTRVFAASPAYTLIELLIVMALIALVVSVAAPASIRAIDGMRLNADARTVVTSIRELQAHAREQQARAILTTDAAGQINVLEQSVPLPNGSTAHLVTPKNNVVFYEDGTVSGGRLRLELADRRVDVAIAWLTGKATIEVVP